MSLAAVALLAASLPLAVPGQPSVVPWPIGRGAAYRPAATTDTVQAGRPLGTLRCTRQAASYHVHLELFARRRVIVVPAGIGVASPERERGAELIPQRCTYPLWTVAPGGVIEARGPARLDLAELFRVWGQRLGARRLASFVSARPVRAYLDGRLVHGPVGAIVLSNDAEIVLELGGYVVPHASFLFSGAGT